MNEPFLPRSTPRPYLILWLLALFVSAQVAIAWLQYRQSEDELQGIVFSITEFGDYGDEFCPGDTIYISNTARLVKSPEVFRLIDTIWSADKRFTVVRDTEPEYVVITEAASPETSISITLPELEPGNYELRHAAECFGCNVAHYTVKFSIGELCGGDQ